MYGLAAGEGPARELPLDAPASAPRPASALSAVVVVGACLAIRFSCARQRALSASAGDRRPADTRRADGRPVAVMVGRLPFRVKDKSAGRRLPACTATSDPLSDAVNLSGKEPGEVEVREGQTLSRPLIPLKRPDRVPRGKGEKTPAATLSGRVRRRSLALV